MGRILVATDGSATATAAVDRAVEVALATGNGLTVLSAGRTAEAVCAAEADRLAGSGVDVVCEAVEADPATAILDAAEAGDVDLVVLGNRGMTGPRRRYALGSVPNKVSHALERPLLLVRTT